MVVIYSLCPGIHLDERIPDDVVDKGTCIELSQDKAEGIGGRVGEEDEAVPCERLVQVEFVVWCSVGCECLVAR